MKWKSFLLGSAYLFIASSVLADDVRNVELLASSCSSCHGTRGYSVAGTPSLAGLDKLHFLEQMDQFISNSRSSTIMYHHANGYTAEEIEMLAEFFSEQNKP